MKLIGRWMLAASLLTVSISLTLFNATAQDSATGGATFFATNTPIGGQNSFQLATTPTPQPTRTAQPVTPTMQPTAAATPIQVFEPDECRYQPGQTASAACLSIIEAIPEPVVDDIRLDGETLSLYSFWRIGPQAVNTYDAPGGSVTGQIPGGFNFVNAINEADGWIQSEDGDWIHIEEASAYYVTPSNFTGVTLPEGWNQPFGWILDTTGIYASTYPGGPASAESGLVPLRYQRYSIFAESVDSAGWTWYMVGADQWVKQTYMSVIKPTQRPENVHGRWVAVDLFEQSLVAYEDDRPVFATLISSGLPNFSTNEGLFEVWARLPRDTMSGATGAPDAYALQSVPWVQYFDDSISLHGTYWHDLFGYRRSHGCVNLSISDARWVFEWMTQAEPDVNGNVVNYVYVFSSDEYRS